MTKFFLCAYAYAVSISTKTAKKNKCVHFSYVCPNISVASENHLKLQTSRTRQCIHEGYQKKHGKLLKTIVKKFWITKIKA